MGTGLVHSTWHIPGLVEETVGCGAHRLRGKGTCRPGVGSQRRQTGARIGEQAPMCGDVRQDVRMGARRCGRLSAGWQTVGTGCARCAGKLGTQAGCVNRLGSAHTRSEGRRLSAAAKACCEMLKHKTCAGHVMGRLRLVFVLSLPLCKQTPVKWYQSRLRGSVTEIVWVRSVKAQTVSLGDGRPRRDQYSLGSHGGARNGRKPEMKVKEELPETVLKGLESVSDEISCLTDAVDYKLESLKADLRLVKKAVANSGTDGSAVAPKVRVPDPKPFGGERSAKELENFLGHGNCQPERIETWEVLKKELKDQFLPCNTSWLARESLRNLKHTGTVREFVKEFSSLMLDTELRRQGVKDLPTAIAAADRLGDYKVPNEPEQRSDDSGDGKAKFGKKFKKKDKVKEVMTETSEPRSVERPRAGCSSVEILNTGAGLSKTWQVQSRGVGRHIRKVWLWYQAESTLGLDVRTWDSRVKAVNSKAVPVSGVADAELCVGGDKPSFVKGEYDGGTEREEMHRRWTKAQQICGAEPETFTCEEMLKRERECEVGHSSDVREGKRASPVTTGVGTAYAESADVCWLVLVSWQRLVHSTWHIPGLVEETVECGADRLRGKGTCRPGIGSQRRQTGADGRAGAHVRRRSAGCAHGRAQADGSRQTGRRLAQDAPMSTRQVGRLCADRLGSARTRSAGRRLSAAAKAWWLAANAEA
ncbi:UNVERIFIED_CONTAM: hypothetical protein Sangu_1188500 [Sesamum angustifolium]|uniref:Retrotransposon gag domain-containing protein n=1 Tax=Sesamum angustifolium TaxID=2727405 RepID=A0AAW2NKK9_9LAMI